MAFLEEQMKKKICPSMSRNVLSMAPIPTQSTLETKEEKMAISSGQVHCLGTKCVAWIVVSPTLKTGFCTKYHIRELVSMDETLPPGESIP